MSLRTDPRNRSRAIAMAALAAVALIPWVFPVGTYSVPRHDARAAISRELALATVPFIDLTNLAARPLFLSGRRPIPKPASTPRKSTDGNVNLTRSLIPTPSIAGYALVGTIISPRRSLALVRQSAGAQAVAIKAGDAIGPWTVVSIENDAVRLRAGTLVETLGFSATRSSLPSNNMGPPLIPNLPRLPPPLPMPIAR